MDIEVPYITDDGIPLHQLTQDEQRGYTIGLSVDQANSILQHSKRLSARIKQWQAERADMRKKSRAFLRLPEGASEEVKKEKLEGLAQLKIDYDKKGEDIEGLKKTVYKLDSKGQLIIPRMPKA